MSPFEFHWPASAALQHPLPDPRLLLSLQNSPIPMAAAAAAAAAAMNPLLRHQLLSDAVSAALHQPAAGAEAYLGKTFALILSCSLTFKCELWPRRASCSGSPLRCRLRHRHPPALAQSPPQTSPSELLHGSVGSFVDELLTTSPTVSSPPPPPPPIPTAMDNNSNGSPTMELVQQQQRFSCEKCRRSYTTSAGLLKHRESGSCGRGVASHHVAASAAQSSEPVKRFSCTRCHKVYYSLSALKMHIRTHTLPCQCKICGKAFSRMWLLNGHIRTHTGEKPFECGVCQRAFADRSNLRAHMQTHSEVKKYRCQACGKTFSRMGLLTKHRNGGGGCCIEVGIGVAAIATAAATASTQDSSGSIGAAEEDELQYSSAGQED
uniref:Protein krueppel n=1 Tax=Macrostomum lignano TaxID=282301 RepID=A0A1I8JNJ0_9PLAT